MARHIATVRLALAGRTVEPGGSIEPHELEPAVWTELVRKSRIVEQAADDLVVGEMAPVGTPHRPLVEGEWPADIKQRLAGLPEELSGVLVDLSPEDASA